MTDAFPLPAPSAAEQGITSIRKPVHIATETMNTWKVGTRVTNRRAINGPSGAIVCPAGTPGRIVRIVDGSSNACVVRFEDGREIQLPRHQLALPGDRTNALAAPDDRLLASGELYDRVILRVIAGSRAFGLSTQESDTDWRGVFLPTAEMHWSMCDVPEQLENDATEEVYWELEKFLKLALRSNPNILETLYSPRIDLATPLGRELIGIRSCFLSRLALQTFRGYVDSQFRRILADRRNRGHINWKQAMHLIRLLLSGVHLLRHGELQIDVGPHRGRLLEIRQGQVPLTAVEQWRVRLERDLVRASEATPLPPRPDFERVNAFLIRARRLAAQGGLP